MTQDPRPWAAGLRKRVLACLALYGDMTAVQLAGKMGVAPEAVRPRMTELAQLSAIRDTGRRVGTGRGRPAVVWSIA